MADFVHGDHHTTTATATAAAAAAYDMEYRTKDDDAWYSVRLVLSTAEEKTTLTVQFHGFPEVSDLIFKADEFENEAAVDDFLKRFRPVSKQLQDSDCFQLVKGMTVCAAISCGLDDLRFFDAVVDEVRHQGHLLRDGEEECLCTFILFWLHGPRSGKLTIVSIANICIIQVAAQADPRIASFTKFAKEKMQIACSKSCIGSQQYTSILGGSLNHKEIVCLSLSEKSSFKIRLQDDNETESYCGNKGKDEERVILSADVDEDFGGYDLEVSSHYYYIMIDNLENDLSTSSIRRFILENTCVSLQAYIFPSRLSAPSASGAIASASKKSLEQIYDYLINPKHLIVSARGRPWVISGKVLSGAFRETLVSLPDESQDEFQKKSWIKDLKVVHSGTEAYTTAKQLRDLYMDFVNHEQLLYKRLAFEESRILKASQSLKTSYSHRRANTCK